MADSGKEESGKNKSDKKESGKEESGKETTKMPSAKVETKEDTGASSLQHHISEVQKDPNYRVLTKEEYDLLVNASLKQGKTSTPLVKTKISTMEKVLHSAGKPVHFDFPKTPDVPPTPTCTISTQYNFPKLPTFSGADDSKQGEVKYEVWNFEVKCLQNSGQYPEHILLQSVRNSLKGLARSMLVSIGENASLKDILTKLDGFFGNVASGETLMQSFYNDMQKEGESLVVYASRLEDTLSKAIKYGHIDAVAKDGMLRSKFWTGLYNVQLKQSTRHLFDSIKNFEYLLREIRKVQQEELSTPVRKTQRAFQQAERAETTDLQKELQKLTSTMQSPSYRRKAESSYYQIPNMSRAHVKGSVSLYVTTGDLYVSSDEEDSHYITQKRLSTRTVYEDGILLRSGNSLKNARTVIEKQNIKNRRTLQGVNVNKNARESRRSLQSLSTLDNGRESRSTTRTSRSRRSQASNLVTSTNQMSETRSSTRSSSASMSSLMSSKSSFVDSVRKTLIGEFNDLEMEKGMKEIQNSNRKIKLYGLDQVDSDEMSGIESEVEFTGTNMSGYHSNSSHSRSHIRNSQSDTTTTSSTSTSDSSSSVVTTTTTTVVTTIIETITTAARPLAEPVWNTVGEPIWNHVGRPVWNRVGRPVWRYMCRPLLLLTSRVVSTVLLLLFHLIWTSTLRHLVNGCAFVTRKTLSAAQSIIVQMFVWEVGFFSRMSNLSRMCCIVLPLLLILPLLLFAIYPYIKPAAFLDIRDNDSILDLSKMKGISPHELREHVRRIVIQISEGRDESLSVGEVEKIVATMVEQRLNEEKLANQNRWLEEEAAKQQKEKMNITEEILRVLQHLNVQGDSLTEGDIRTIVGKVVQHEVTGLQERITEQAQSQVSEKKESGEVMLALQNDLKTSITNLEQKLADELERLKSHTVEGSDATVEASASLLQIQDDLTSVRARLDSLELEKAWLAGQLKNCCRNETFYTAMVQDKVNLILGQIMSGNDTGTADQYLFGAWLNSTFIKKSDLEKYMADFGEELSNKILQEMSRIEATEVYVSDSGGQAVVTEKVVKQIVTEALEKFSADKIALPDFALESAGGSIISTKCSETFHKNTARLSILGIPLWYVSNSPRSVIQPETQPGSCWAFQGDKGHLVIELSDNINPTAFTLEHIPKSLAPKGKIDSAPKDFTVIGLNNENDKLGERLGNFTYTDRGPPLQTFKVQKPNVGVYKFVQLSILSNHGNPLYTCLYRFRVHGIPHKPKKREKN